MRRHPKRLLDRPVDPRSRRVISFQMSGRFYSLELECGHAIKRRLMCAPSAVICTECPPAGGLGGTVFERHR
jgi:hypothetical protein